MTEHEGYEGDNVEHEADVNADNVSAETLTADQQRIVKWQEAASNAPSSDDLRAMLTECAEARAMLDAAVAKYEAAAATRALVYGWQRVADDEGVTPKRLHNWHREHVPHLEDLSSVPDKEMKREERRIESANRRLAEEARLREQVEAQRARLIEAQKGLNR